VSTKTRDHHSRPLEAALWQYAEGLVGGEDAWLIIDDTALPKKGMRSVGVAPQYASALGKRANCQTLVSTTLASGEVPVMLSLRLLLPESWTSDDADGEGWRRPSFSLREVRMIERVSQIVERAYAADPEKGERQLFHSIGRQADQPGQTRKRPH
jgi:hypothetical protein